MGSKQENMNQGFKNSVLKRVKFGLKSKFIASAVLVFLFSTPLGEFLYRFLSKIVPSSLISRPLLMNIINLLVIGIMLNYIIEFLITRRLIKMIRAVREFGKGDLSQRLEVEKNDIISILSEEINKSFGSTADLVEEISQLSGQSLDTVTRVNDISQDFEKSIFQITNGTEELSQGNVKNASLLEETNVQVEGLLDLIDKSAETIEQVKVQSDSALDSANTGKKVMTTLQERMEQIQVSSEKSNKVTTELSQSSAKIQDIFNQIDSIANQINLLALNASIEAANAGEYGKGFNVVAEEIRQLAEETQTFTTEVGTVLTDIDDMVMETVKISNINRDTVAEGNQILTDTRDVFEEILEKVHKNLVIVTDVLEIKDAELDKSNKVEENLRPLVAFGQEISGQSEEIAATLEEQGHGIEKLADISGDLEGLVKKLDSLIDNFDIN